MERKSLVGLSFILLILVAARVHAEECLDQAEDAEEYLVQAEDAEEYLILAEARAPGEVRLYRPCPDTKICDRRCKQRRHASGKCRNDGWCWCKKIKTM